MVGFDCEIAGVSMYYAGKLKFALHSGYGARDEDTVAHAVDLFFVDWDYGGEATAECGVA